MRFITEEQLITILKNNGVLDNCIANTIESIIWASCYTCSHYNGYCRLGNGDNIDVCGCWELANRLDMVADCKKCNVSDLNCYKQCMI